MSITMLPRAGMDCRTVDTIICRFFRNLHQIVTHNLSVLYVNLGSYSIKHREGMPL